MYKEFKVNFSHAQSVHILHGKPVRLSHTQLNNGPVHYFHVENYKKLVKAYEAGKGTTIHMSHGEVLRTHQSGLSGSGFWDSLCSGIKSGASTAWNFLKNNWKPIAGTVLDKVADIAAPETGGLSKGVRAGFKTLTGVGIDPPIDALPQVAAPRRGRRKKNWH
ncbi:hypothetical protein THRCLA_21124 [Thraustotheca clavata]|uniref:Uncharacterized protein n=1 Tax=Thraustotheca clavata TaxID=74557 RepID=A0A1W0A064_9STRA|nr:hypothetical protein THRCLA_21124 [Thraustotheca clavata]